MATGDTPESPTHNATPHGTAGVLDLVPLTLLDADVPIALLPVRIETVFDPPEGPVRLLIRIYPDDLHGDELRRSLTEEEREAARAFWEAAWPHFTEASPSGWVDEDLPQVHDLLDALNSATEADALEVYFGVGDVRSERLLRQRPDGGYTQLFQLLQIHNLSFKTVQQMLAHHGGVPPSWFPRWGFLRGLPEPEVLAVWQLRPGERTRILDFLNTATLDELDAVQDFGPAVAGTLLDRRDTDGSFQDLFTVVSVGGMGVDRLFELRDHLAPAPLGGVEAALPAWRTLVAELGPVRGSWAAQAMWPSNAPVRGTPPEFPAPDVSADSVRALATLLPERFHVRGYRSYRRIIDAEGEPIPRTLPLGPDLHGDEPGVDDGMRWMVDYDEAEAKGMAITVPLEGLAAEALLGIDELAVYGVRNGDAASTLETLLASHRYTRGLALLAQGTPTNNTDEVRSAWQEESTDERFHHLFEPPRRPANATRLIDALGLDDDSVLAGIDGADDPEQDEAAAMNRLLWWGLLDPTFRVIMRGDIGRRLVPDDAHDWVERFFVDQVRGGGPLPVMRVGRQPYGVLPVVSAARGEHSGPNGDLVDVLWRIRQHWVNAAANVARLDPDRLDDLAGIDDVDTVTDAELVRILATQAHPVTFHVSGVEDRQRDADGRIGIQGQYNFFRTMCVFAKETQYSEWSASFPADYGDRSYATLEAQIAWWEDAQEKFEDEVLATRSGEERATARAVITHMITPILKILNEHKKRVDQVRIPVRGPTRPDGVMGEDDPQVLFALFDEGAPTPFGPERVDSATEDAPPPSEYLAWLASRCSTSRAHEATDRGPFSDTAAPLLYQLAARAVRGVAGGTQAYAELRQALERLAALPPERVDLRFRESIGLLGPRIDAWFTALAWSRLADARAREPHRLRVGAFGWVEDLHPDRGADTSQGFVHAPSLDHAALAGLLRAGWLAHGTDNPLSPVATNLRSDRIRLAKVLLDGIRNGSSLGTMLGTRFERGLRDAGHGGLIQDYREALSQVLADDPEPPSPGPIDGERLLEHVDHPTVAAIAASEGSTALDGVLEQLRDSLDAVADAVLAEGVFQLVRGNPTRAAATFEAISAGERPPPPLEMVQTPRPGPVVEHRVMLLWPSDGGDPLESWLSDVLGPLDEVGFTLSEDGTVHHHALSELGLAPSRLVAMAPEPGTAVSPELAAAIADRFGAATLDPDDPGPHPVALAEHGLLAAAVRRLVAHARPVVDADLADPTTVPERARADAPAWLAAPVDLNDNLAHSRTPDPRAVDGWLAQMSRVRPRLASHGDVEVLREALWGDIAPPARVAQWPMILDGAGRPELWAAVTAPAGNRACVVALGAPAAGSVAGLVIDEWTERVPTATATTGVAFHVDSPAARAPQSILLGLCPAGESWSLDRVENVVREALALTRIRPVESGMIAGLGQVLPLTFTPEPLDIPEAS